MPEIRPRPSSAPQPRVAFTELVKAALRREGQVVGSGRSIWAPVLCRLSR